MAYCVSLGVPHSAFLAWDTADQDKALAWRRVHAAACPNCRTREDEWQADRFAYVGQQYACLGCEVLEQERENVPESARAHTHVYLVPREQAKTTEEEGVEM